GIRLDHGLWMKTYGQMKSMMLNDMLPPLVFGGVRKLEAAVFVNLQVGPERGEIKEAAAEVIDVLPELPTWDDTAALVECLDVVISVETALSHLAGAMGKPVMLAMHCNGSWHYMADRPGPWQHKNPWYPNTTVYRQKQNWQWNDVMNEIASDLGRTDK